MAPPSPLPMDGSDICTPDNSIIINSLQRFTSYYREVIGTQSCTIGKAISPFLSNQVTYYIVAIDYFSYSYNMMLLRGSDLHA